jgi:hypothetical protein
MNARNLCRADHECAHMRRIEWQRGAAVGTGPALSERRPPAELAQLAGELPRMMRGDGRFLVEPITAHHVDRSLQNEPGRGLPFAHAEHDLVRCKATRRTAGKAPCGLDLARIEYGEHLLMASFNDAHSIASDEAD